MTRREFPRAVRVSVVKRATLSGVVYCEKCGLPAKKWQVDHVIADAHGGDPVLENAQLLGECCYSIKNPQDTKIAAKIKRQQAAALRIKTSPAATIKSAPFPTTEKAAARRERAATTDKTRIGIGGRWVFGTFIEY